MTNGLKERTRLMSVVTELADMERKAFGDSLLYTAIEHVLAAYTVKLLADVTPPALGEVIEETPEQVHTGFLNALTAMREAIDSCATLGEAMIIWTHVREMEQALATLSNLAGQKADSLQETR